MRELTYYVFLQVVIGVPSGHFGVPWCSQDTRELTYCPLASPFSLEQVCMCVYKRMYVCM